MVECYPTTIQNIQKKVQSRYEIVTTNDNNTVVELARCLLSFGEYSEGERYASMLLENEDFYNAGLMGLSRSYLIQRKQNKAMEWLSKMDMSISGNLRMRGYYYSMVKQFDSAFYYSDSAYVINQQFFSINL